MLSDLAWLQPELTSAHRLPMHSVPHQDRMILDGTGPFQLLDHPDAEPTSTWRHIEVPGCWTMQNIDESPWYTNVVMPFDGRPPQVPHNNPTGIYEREFEAPAEWTGKRCVRHV